MLVLPAAALHASAGLELREAITRADRALDNHNETRRAESSFEIELSAWFEARIIPISVTAHSLPSNPDDLPQSPGEDVAIAAVGPKGTARPASLMRGKTIPRHAHGAKVPGRECDAHVPSAYLKYLSIRFHAGPPA